jgi:Protein kinase domain
MATSVCPLAETELIASDDFHLIKLLGQGGTGAVYAARHRGTDVALKVLREDLALSERERGRFLEEAVRMRRVEHEGLVRLLGSGVLSDGRPYLCMPRLRGETLASRLDRGPLPLDAALSVFDTLAEAVAVLHRAGLIHRDIKPENVFLEGSSDASDEGGADVPHPVLLDFGIARDVSESESTTTAAGQTRGTPAYMAPERFFGTVANVRTDVYELGVTLYAMLTGRLPWDDVQSAANRLSPILPSAAGVDLPAELVTVLLRALSTRPEVRPESADSFADLIRRAIAVAGATGTASESGRTTATIEVGGASDRAGPSIAPVVFDEPSSIRGARGARRSRGVWAASGVFAVLAASVLAYGLRTAPSAPPPVAAAQVAQGPSPIAVPALPGVPAVTQAEEAPLPIESEREVLTKVKTQLPPPPASAVAPAAPHPRPVSSATATAPVPATSPATSADRYYRDRK